MLRNRIHRLLGGQHEVKLPQCSDLFGHKGVGFWERLELPAPARLLLIQQLTLLKELAVRIREDEKTLEGLLEQSLALQHVRSLPGMGPILAAVVVSEIDGIERFPSAQKLCGYAGFVLPPAAAGARLFKANCYDIATNGSVGPSSRRPGWPSVARPTLGTSTNASERLARNPASHPKRDRKSVV